MIADGWDEENEADAKRNLEKKVGCRRSVGTKGLL
jgi:hypothetical protein